MGSAAVLHLKYLGRDSWDRPVYEDDNGVVWKDVEPRAMNLTESRIQG